MFSYIPIQLEDTWIATGAHAASRRRLSLPFLRALVEGAAIQNKVFLSTRSRRSMHLSKMRKMYINQWDKSQPLPSFVIPAEAHGCPGKVGTEEEKRS